MADKISGAVFVGGRTFVAGDEKEFAAYRKDNAKMLTESDMQRLRDSGQIDGYGTKEPGDDTMAADPTFSADRTKTENYTEDEEKNRGADLDAANILDVGALSGTVAPKSARKTAAKSEK